MNISYNTQKTEIDLLVTPPKQSGGHRITDRLIRDKYLYLMFLPVLVFYVIFRYVPMYGLIISFQNYKPFKGVFGSEWIGIENFKIFFSSPFCWRLIRNSFLINIYGLVLGFPAPIILAILFNDIANMKFKRIAQTISYLPYFVSIVIVCGLVVNFLSPSTGVVNTVIRKLGFEPVYFLSKPPYFRIIFTLMNIWKETGFRSVIYFAALAAVDVQLYEAAIVDGANKWRQLIHVTLPGIAPTIIIMLILRMGHMLTVGFESVINLYNPMIYETADVINTYVYRIGLQGTRYSMAAAVGFFQSIISLILVVGANEISKRVSETHLW